MAVASPLMAELQPENSPTIQDFLHWLCSSDTHRKGCGNTIGVKYIPQAALVEKLTRERTEALLNDLFRDVDQPVPDADDVMGNYLRPFAILLAAGFGRMISHFVEHLSLRDQYLPFRVESNDFPKSTRRDLYKAFCEKQWQFCPVKLEYNMKPRLDSSYILPVVHKDKIGDGGSANLYKIVIDEGYNSLKPSKLNHESSSYASPDTFVLKTYRTPDAERYFETERSAFIQLRYGNMPPANIVEYYGSFVQDGTYNIVLEYADQGTLEHYMRNTHEPTSIGEIMTFWKRFLAIYGGLSHIHGTRSPNPNPDEPGSLLGWHHDISPDNILVVSRRGGSPYDCDFKIADLGLSHFRRHTSSPQDATDEDKYGSNAYGAPETYRSSDSEESQKSHLQVSQSADVWSMGCILSEVITWVTEGRQKLKEYRRRRQEEVGKTSVTSEDRFHCNGDVLETVNQLHDELRENSRRHDYVTPTIIEGLVHSSIVMDHQSRGSAHSLSYQSNRILKDAQKRLDCGPSSRPSPNTHHTVSDGILEVKSRRLPPNLPPRFNSPSSTEHLLVDLEDADLGQTLQLPIPLDSFREREVHGGVVQDGTSRESFTNSISGHDPDNDMMTSERSQAQYQQHHFAPRRPGRILSQPVSSKAYLDYLRKSSANPGQLLEMPPQNNPLGITADTTDDTQTSHVPFRPRQLRQPPKAPRGPAPRPSTTEGISQVPGYRGSDPFVQGEMVAPDPLPATSDPGAEFVRYRPARNDRPHPRMSVQKGLEIKRAREHGQNVKYPDQDLFQTLDDVLEKRDHAFLVDNAESMGQYRDQVRRVLELLSALTRPYDPDGLDLFFSTQPRKHKPKTNGELLRLFDERPAHGLPDMRERFASIIEQHSDRFGRKNVLRRIRHPNSTPSKGPRRLNLYVLTDGVWQPGCTLVTEIKTLVSRLQEHKLSNKHVGIQFIRFGNDAEGKKRLRLLDSGLKLELDVVDTTSADGNVWKMLLGAVNDWFDDDHDDMNDANEA